MFVLFHLIIKTLMSEILPNEHHKKAGVRKTKKASLRIDLTPMVDLGFLLISFFVFTTTLAKSTGMKLNIPDDRNIIDSSKAEASKTLNLILGANNNIYYYEGGSLNQIKSIGSEASGLRDIINQKKITLRNKYGNDSCLIVLIKPTENATYENIINSLDEMLICSVKTYVLMDASDNEIRRIRN